MTQASYRSNVQVTSGGDHALVRTFAPMLGVLALSAGPLSAQPVAACADDPPPPAIRRWIDVQHLHLSSRFRWVKASDGRLTSSTLQWQPQVRSRVLFDREARYSLHVGASSGRHFVLGWNNTGGGMGKYSGTFHVRHFFGVASPGRGVELQAGSLHMLRGENSEITSYDNDAFIAGQRVLWRPSRGPLRQLAITTAYIGEFLRPNAFERLRRLGEWNYGQVLVGWRVSPQVQASADYTHEDGRDILRQGLIVRLPGGPRGLAALRAEAYERLAPDPAAGLGVAADLTPHARLGLTVGVAAIDRRYGPLNGDRYEVGTRAYWSGTLAVARDLSIGWFHGEAFATPYRIPNRHRFELLATFNPTATLKQRRVF